MKLQKLAVEPKSISSFRLLYSSATMASKGNPVIGLSSRETRSLAGEGGGGGGGVFVLTVFDLEPIIPLPLFVI